MDESEKHHKLLYTLASIFIIIFLFTHYLWLLYVALAFHFIELLVEPVARKIDKFLSIVFHYIGRFNTAVLLTLIYYLVLTPVAFFARLFDQVGYDRAGNDKSTQFKTRNYTFDSTDLENMW